MKETRERPSRPPSSAKNTFSTLDMGGLSGVLSEIMPGFDQMPLQESMADRMLAAQRQARQLRSLRPERGPGVEKLVLLTPSQVDRAEACQGNGMANPDGIREQDLHALVPSLAWMREFIMLPHGRLGRPGAVCPFVKSAIEKDYLFLSVVRAGGKQAESVITRAVMGYRDLFLKTEPLSGEMAVYKCIAILLPDLSVPSLAGFMEPLHQHLKTELLKDELMIGQFYPGCMVPGTWNGDFYPLQSPVPMFVIRYLIETDWRFLKGNDHWEASFLEKFGEPGKIRT